MRWKPGYQEQYYFIDDSGRLGTGWFNEVHKYRIEFGNCFRTRHEAREAAKAVKKALAGKGGE